MELFSMDESSGIKKSKKVKEESENGELNITNKAAYLCNQCEYTGSNSTVYYHKHSKHKGIRYPCDQCEYSATKLPNSNRHKESKHEGVRLPCDQCDFCAINSSHLKKHKESKHEGIRYPCDQCDYAATIPISLKRHKESKHEGIRYSCDQCEYTATHQGSVKNHKPSKHEGIRYPCDQCDYAATQHGNLKFHKKSKHSEVTIQSNSTILKRKVNVSIEKLDYSEYLRAKDNAVEPESIQTLQMNDTESEEMIPLHSAETEVKKENFTEDEYNETPVNKENSEYCDLESKIEIEEDMVLLVTCLRTSRRPGRSMAKYWLLISPTTFLSSIISFFSCS